MLVNERMHAQKTLTSIPSNQRDFPLKSAHMREEVNKTLSLKFVLSLARIHPKENMHHTRSSLSTVEHLIQTQHKRKNARIVSGMGATNTKKNLTFFFSRKIVTERNHST